jgi:copper homeostasis protein
MGAMSGLLQVVALDARDAERAEAGGADRVYVVGDLDDGGMSPEPRVVASVRERTGVQVRPLVRLRRGYATDGGEAVRLRGLIASYIDAGADGVALGFVNGLGRVDTEVVSVLIEDGSWPWTFHRAVDACLDADLAWRTLEGFARLDGVLTAGSSRDVEYGLDDLLQRARTDARASALIVAGGGLHPDHVPWLTRAGVTAFHVDTQVRVDGAFAGQVDVDLVRTWRLLVDAETARRRSG